MEALHVRDSSKSQIGGVQKYKIKITVVNKSRGQITECRMEYTENKHRTGGMVSD